MPLPSKTGNPFFGYYDFDSIGNSFVGSTYYVVEFDDGWEDQMVKAIDRNKVKELADNMLTNKKEF